MASTTHTDVKNSSVLYGLNTIISGSAGETAFTPDKNAISTTILSTTAWTFKYSNAAASASSGSAFTVGANQPFSFISFRSGDPHELAGKKIYITPGTGAVDICEVLRWQP